MRREKGKGGMSVKSSRAREGERERGVEQEMHDDVGERGEGGRHTENVLD